MWLRDSRNGRQNVNEQANTGISVVNENQMAMVTSRQAQEVQAAMILARNFPRDVNAAIVKIKNSCKRMSLAEKAIYSYPRGSTQIEGPSIRLAECIAQNYGNIDFGMIEIEQRHGESTVMAYCWDLETNTRQTKVFTAPHVRDTKGGRQVVTEARDIYEVVANVGARRVRACILGVIPGDIVDEAMVEVNRTLVSGSEGPIEDQVRRIVSDFQEHHGVTIEMLEARLQHKLDATSPAEVVQLKKIFVSLRDGMSKREDWFSIGDGSEDSEPEPEKATGTRTERATKRTKKAKAAEVVHTYESVRQRIEIADTKKMVQDAMRDAESAGIDEGQLASLDDLAAKAIAELEASD